jgi:hypothetical protein
MKQYVGLPITVTIFSILLGLSDRYHINVSLWTTLMMFFSVFFIYASITTYQEMSFDDEVFCFKTLWNRKFVINVKYLDRVDSAYRPYQYNLYFGNKRIHFIVNSKGKQVFEKMIFDIYQLRNNSNFTIEGSGYSSDFQKRISQVKKNHTNK